MLGSLVWWQIALGFFLGAFFGQRFVHLHPIASVKDAQ